MIVQSWQYPPGKWKDANLNPARRIHFGDDARGGGSIPFTATILSEQTKHI